MKRALFITLFTIIAQFGLTIAACADPSTGIAVDRQGRVYFADERRNIVWKIETDGRLIPFITGRHAHKITLDEQGHLFGEHLRYLGDDRWEFHLWKATPAGEVSYVIPPTPGFPPGLLTDRAGNRYQWGGSGNIRKTSSLIERRAPDGTITVIAGSGWGRADGKGARALLSSVGGMAWGPDGALYVTDGMAVRRVTLDGEVKTIARGNPPLKPALSWRMFSGMGGHLFGLTVDEHSNIYVANFGGDQVAKVTPDGQVSTLVKAESGWSPTGVTMADGALYILEHGDSGPRVRKLSADGRITTLATVSPANQKSLTGMNSDRIIKGAALIGLIIALLIISVFLRSVWRLIRELQLKREEKIFWRRS
jgi:DNA-binding beta-propeller fold protein YncE